MPSGGDAAAPSGSRCNLVAAAHSSPAPEQRTPLTDDQIDATEAFKILSQFPTPKDICISVKGEYWERLPELRGKRLSGIILQWVKKTSPDRKLKVQWEDGHDVEHLDQLLHPDVDLQFLPYANGRPPPRLQGRAAIRELQAQQQAAVAPETVIVEYDDGSVRKQQVWTVLQPTAVTVDQRTEEWQKPKLNRELKSLQSPYKMWVQAALPINMVLQLQRFMNQRLTGAKDDFKHRKTSPGEVIRFLSYMGALAIERGLPLDEMWRNSKLEKDLRQPPAFGDHGMSKNRFNHLRSLAAKMWDVSAESESADPNADCWRWCRMPVDTFNEHYAEVFVPGTLTGPDESMAPYEGIEGDDPHNIPHLHFVKRKPKDLGAELNTQADGQAGGIYRLDIERAKADPFPRKFQDEWGYTTALNLRLAETILNSNRIFSGDSRFMSVDAIEDLHLNGLYGIGDVKTKTSRYPVQKIKELCGQEPGDWSVMSTELADGFKVYAIGHRRGGEVHTFVSSCGLTVPGKPQKHPEDKSVYGNMEPRKCPQVLNWWTQQQPKIDKNNRFRQDILAIEERFVTKSFPFRMLTTVLGMTFANAYEWYCYFVDADKYTDFLSFLRELTFDGMHNTYDDVANAHSSSTAGPSATQRARGSPMRRSPRALAMQHKAIGLKSLPNYRGSNKQKCVVCKDNLHKTSWCCSECSTAERVFSIHPNCVSYAQKTIMYDCLKKHLQEPDLKEHWANIVIPSGRKHSGSRRKRPLFSSSSSEDDD